MLRLRRFEVLGAGAAVAEHPAALDEPLALLVHAFGERQHREIEVLHALEREVLELLQAEVARPRAGVVLEVARAAARVRGEVATGRARRARSPLVVQRQLPRVRLQLDGLGVVAQVARRHEHARIPTALRLLRFSALQLGPVVRRVLRWRFHGRRDGRALA